ncbi:MAG: SpoIIIAC/SpoIIIAD family protein [Tissierellia bacterium]|nr:SpoIIIAC/SpoIIIAD family protein [Tissierellia bacterium]MDD4780786.1 SpoIIIAC/SpoIIIAD family protein [Tissierellia bacterium]
MILTKIIFVAVITIILSIIISKVNPEFKIYISVIFGVLVLFLLFGQAKNNISEFVDLFNKYDIKIENFSIILKIVGIAYICDFIALLCKDLNYEAIGKKIEAAGKIIILIYSFEIIKIFLDQIMFLVNR